MNVYLALACMAACSVTAYMIGGATGRLTMQAELERTQIAAALILKDATAAGFAEGEAAVQLRVAVAEILRLEDEQ